MNHPLTEHNQILLCLSDKKQSFQMLIMGVMGVVFSTIAFTYESSLE